MKKPFLVALFYFLSTNTTGLKFNPVNFRKVMGKLTEILNKKKYDQKNVKNFFKKVKL